MGVAAARCAIAVIAARATAGLCKSYGRQCKEAWGQQTRLPCFIKRLPKKLKNPPHANRLVRCYAFVSCKVLRQVSMLLDRLQRLLGSHLQIRVLPI